MANALLDQILDTALATHAGTLATSNIGCALHIAAGLQERGGNMPVFHPVALLAQQLRPKTKEGG
jgi:glycolate oxidase iron-sulfur subunit